MKKEQYVLDAARLQAVGKAVASLDAALKGYRQLAIDVVGLNIRRPKVEGGEFFAVVKGLDAEGTPCVAFHSAYSLDELVQGLDSRISNGSLKWRVDEFMK